MRRRPLSPVPVPRGKFRLVSLLDRSLGAFEIAESRLSRRESARRAHEQLDA